ncbi:MAG: type II and III secretion system protein family protein [Pseudomonadota bacterium]
MNRFILKAPLLAVAAALVAGLLALASGPAAAKGWTEAAAEPSDVFILHIGKARTVELGADVRDALVSDPKIVETSPRTMRQLVLYGMRIGQANILFFDENNQVIKSLEVRVEYDVAVLRDTIRDRHPSATVKVESVLGQVVLSGTVRSSAEASAIRELAESFVAAARASQSEDGEALAVDPTKSGVVNRIAILNDEQIHLQVQVAEVNRTVLKRLGVDWNEALSGTVISDTGLGAVDLLGGETLTLQFLPQTLGTYLQALEEFQLVRTLAEPSLTAVSGEPASFLAGGEFPIPIAAEDNRVTLEFKRFGVGLDFTPVVVGDGRISLQVATEVSELSDDGAVTINEFTIPALTVRRANTTLEVPSGGTVMMAGLIQSETRRLSRGVPGMRQLPVLGSFFRREEQEIDETELVILVTPVAVAAGERADFKLPTDGFAPASDLDMYLFGRLNSVYGAGGAVAGDMLIELEDAQAPIGFMME